jgi:acyl transferase domain-containing protein
MDSTANLFARMFAGRTYRPGKIPIISCADISSVAAEQSRSYTPAHWWQVIREPVRFSQAFALFAGRNPDAVYLDAGPSGNMATFAKYNLPSAQHGRIITVMTQFGCNRTDIETTRDRVDALADAAKTRRLE